MKCFKIRTALKGPGSLLSSMTQIFIHRTCECLTVQEGLPDYWPIPMSVMNTYCFIMSTFILPRHLPGPGVAAAGAAVQGERLHPGVGPEQPGEEREYQAYSRLIRARWAKPASSLFIQPNLLLPFLELSVLLLATT